MYKLAKRSDLYFEEMNKRPTFDVPSGSLKLKLKKTSIESDFNMLNLLSLVPALEDLVIKLKVYLQIICITNFII
jgi:hypothetical protein